MLKFKCLQVAALAFAAVGFGLAPAGDASAGSCSSQRSYDRGHHSSQSRHYSRDSHRNSHRDYSHRGYDSRARVTYRNDNVRFSVNVGSNSSYSHQPTYRNNTYHRNTVVHTTHSQPTGYWKRVYHSPVYETRYQPCGTPYRVCVRAGYYERVWVTTTTTYCR